MGQQSTRQWAVPRRYDQPTPEFEARNTRMELIRADLDAGDVFSNIRIRAACVAVVGEDPDGRMHKYRLLEHRAIFADSVDQLACDVSHWIQERKRAHRESFRLLVRLAVLYRCDHAQCSTWHCVAPDVRMIV